MHREDTKSLMIEFINRAYELIELVENNNYTDCPSESRYLSHGYYLHLCNLGSGFVTLSLVKNEQDDVNALHTEMLVRPNIIEGHNTNCICITRTLDVYICQLFSNAN